MRDYSNSRSRMVSRQIAGRGITDARVLDAMRAVPREAFVKPGFEEFAYEDAPLPIEEGQTISQPYIVGLMLEAAELTPSDRVLDVGTGSGYAAAVASLIANEVYSIERHAALAEIAQERFEKLGYDNIGVRCGDGTNGWPEAAPFDAIVVAAGGPDIPQTLLEQLAIGGRLVMPVGEAPRDQRLLKIVRVSDAEYDEEDLGAVAFVPLIGEHGWCAPEQEAPPPAKKPAREPSVPELIASTAEPLPDVDDAAFGSLFDRFAGARVVLLGEATHGTSQFYEARAAITRRLIERHGFRIVAVEADWPDAAAIDRYVRHKPPASIGDDPPFSRFPTWMWRNAEVHDFIEWLRERNSARPHGDRAGFYGLDLYNMNAAIHAVISYLDSIDPEAARVARERYGCLTPWQKDPQVYGRAALTAGYAPCEQAVVETLQKLLASRLDYVRHDGESFLDAAQNARLIASAERYYRVMYFGSASSWNLRDRHMFETLEHLLSAAGPDARAVVWAHNSHVGNAAATEMGIVREQLNIGQLCRERFADRAVLIGFGTDHGTVAAATDWDGPMEIKQVRPAHRDSYERLCHESGTRRFLLDLRSGVHRELRGKLLKPRLERAIGVIYRPDTELLSHYFDAALPRQFDAYVWFDQTDAVTALVGEQRHEGVPETYPFGL
ncbi:MAG TPA: protein-L-isoaspartate(D-aspartate) O-methyltransferase [Candidatus Limnocylindrales bacterium]|nr:protein-L-isoaspartate(D-aspartate) O-methyltransferase [Candidatus Limnocylindrales bacterium]